MRIFGALVMLLSLACCSVLDSKTQAAFQLTRSWGIGWDRDDVGAAFTTSDVRMITKRRHPVLGNTVICTEPVPDVATALATALSVKGSGGSGGATASLAASGSTSETVAELAGRSTALLGLRDGMYRACEAYANGILGQDAYALILANYGKLMTTLFLAQDISSSAGAEGNGLAAASIAATKSGDSSGTGNSNGGSSQKNNEGTNGGSQQAAAVGDAANPARLLQPIAAIGNGVPPKIQMVTNAVSPNANGAASAEGTPSTPSSTPANTSQNKSTPGSSEPTEAAQAAGVTASAALAIARMNEDYMYDGIMAGIIVACINEADPTRLNSPVAEPGGYANPELQSAKPAIRNAWLEPICDEIRYYQLKTFEAALAARPKIDPTNVPASGTQPSSETKNRSATSDPTVLVVQTKLAAWVPECPKCDPGKKDGVDGKNTEAAISAFGKCIGQTFSVAQGAKDPNLLPALERMPSPCKGGDVNGTALQTPL